MDGRRLLVRALADNPRISEIVAIDDLSTGSLDNLLDLPARLITGTILDPDVLDEAVAGAASVVHLGALGSVPRSIDDPVRSHHANATGTLMVLDAVRRHEVRQTILASSSSVYGANPVLPRRETLRPMPLSPYAVSKLATEAYGWRPARDGSRADHPGPGAAGTGRAAPGGRRPGRRQPAGRARHVRRARPAGGAGVQPGGGRTAFCYVDDAVEAVLRLMDCADASGRIVHIGNDSEQTNIGDLAKLVLQVAGVSPALQPMPAPAGSVQRRCPDLGALRRLTGFEPTVPLEEGVRRTFDWYRTTGFPGRPTGDLR